MKLLLLSQLRFLRRAPWSAITALLGVALGVASVIAVHQIGSAVVRSLDAAQPPHLAGLTHLLGREALDATDYFALRAAWRRGEWPQIEALVPVLEGHLQVRERRTRVVGADWLAYPQAAIAVGRQGGDPGVTPAGVSAFRLLDGQAVVVDRALAVPEGATLLLAGQSFTVVGVVDSGLGAAVFVDIATAYRLLDAPYSTLSFVGARWRDPLARWRVMLDALMPGFAAGLPETALPAQRMPAGFSARAIASELPAAAFARSILFNLGALGLLALVVAWFLVYQVALIWVERQRRVFARFHALGVSVAELRLAFVATFAVLGMLATLIGVALGQLLALALIRISVAGLGDAVPAIGLDGWVLAKAVISGFGVCLAGGLMAVGRAGQSRAVPGWLRLTVSGAAVVSLAIGLGVEATGLLGGFGAILALSVLAILTIRPLLERLRTGARGKAGVAPGLFGLLTRMGLREAVWQPGVVAVALAALALAIATGMGVGLMVESLRSDFARMLQSRLAGDLYVAGAPGVIEPAARWLAAQPSAPGISLHGQAQVRVGVQAAGSAGVAAVRDLPANLGYGDFDAAEGRRYGFDRSSTAHETLAAHETLVNERLARQLDLRVGDILTVAAGRLEVVHVFSGFGDVEPRLLVDAAALPALGVLPLYDRMTLHGAAGHDVATLAEALVRQFPGLDVTAREVVRQQAFALFDRTFAITRALTLLALLVAVVGIYNALTALRLNQAPTQRLLRAQGLSRRELGWVVLVRSATVGGLAVLVALPLGFAMAWMLCHVINPRAFGWTIDLQLPLAGWLPPLALGLSAALLAGLLPAPSERGELDEAG